MTRIVFLTALTALVGCKKDECEDTAGTGACDTGAVDVDADGGDDDGADADGSTPSADSCHWLDGDICVEPNEGDNEAWCGGVAGTYSADACPAGAEGTCAIPAGGDYTAAATGYYYNGFDGETACGTAGGTYTAG